jgi:hypothetical protein
MYKSWRALFLLQIAVRVHTGFVLDVVLREYQVRSVKEAQAYRSSTTFYSIYAAVRYR